MLSDEQRAALRAEAKELRAATHKQRFFVVLWTDNPTADDDAFIELLPDHFRHFGALENAGVLFGSGPLTPPDGVAETYEGMSIVRAATLDDARAIADATPLVRHGLRTYEIFAWDVSVGRFAMRVDLKSGAIAFD